MLISLFSGARCIIYIFYFWKVLFASIGLFLCLVYFLETIFGHGLYSSFIQSPIFDAMSETCLYFRYQISSPKIKLKILGKTSADSNFEASDTVLFGDQEQVGSWNDATVSLPDGVIQFQIIADKTGVSNNIHFVMIDSIRFSSCPDEGTTSIRPFFAFYSAPQSIALQALYVLRQIHLSVCLSVRLSVTLRYCVKTKKHSWVAQCL